MKVSIVFFLLIVLSAQAKEGECSKVLAPTRYSLRQNLPAILTRFGISKKTKNYNIWIVSRDRKRNLYSPQQLATDAERIIREVVADFRKMGFETQRSFDVAVEAHSLAIYNRIINKKSWSLDFLSPTVGSRGHFARANWMGRVVPIKSAKERLIYLPTFDREYTALYHAFTLSHEFAHLTQNPVGLSFDVWNEARADLLGYLRTGLVQWRFPVLFDLTDELRKSPPTSFSTYIPRDLSNPIITTVSQVENLKYYHENSTILSHALFELQRELGRQWLINMIHMMDRFHDKEVNELYENNGPFPVYLKTRQFLILGQLLRLASELVSPNHQDLVDAQLTKAGI